jgi:hypothetical protein
MREGLRFASFCDWALWEAKLGAELGFRVERI